MNKNIVGMGTFYTANPYGLVRTVCRGFDSESGDPMIGYVNVNDGGCVSDMFLMPENEFANIFVR